MSKVFPGEDFEKNYKFIAKIASFQTKFGECHITQTKNLENQKLYIFKEFRSESKKSLRVLLEFLKDFECFQSNEECLKSYLLTIKEPLKISTTPDKNLHKIIIVQRDLREYSLSKRRKKGLEGIEVCFILREISKLFSFVLRSQIKETFFHSDYLKVLNCNNIFYYDAPSKTPLIKLDRDRLKIDFLVFEREKGPSEIRSKELEMANPKKSSSSKLHRTDSKSLDRPKELEREGDIRDRSHAVAFLSLITELLLDCSLNKGPETETSMTKMEDELMRKKKVPACLKSLLIKGIHKAKDQNVSEVKLWIYLQSNPLLKPDFSVKVNFDEWKFAALWKSKFSKIKLYRFKKTKNENSSLCSEGQEDQADEEICKTLKRIPQKKVEKSKEIIEEQKFGPKLGGYLVQTPGFSGDSNEEVTNDQPLISQIRKRSRNLEEKKNNLRDKKNNDDSFLDGKDKRDHLLSPEIRKKSPYLEKERQIWKEIKVCQKVMIAHKSEAKVDKPEEIFRDTFEHYQDTLEDALKYYKSEGRMMEEKKRWLQAKLKRELLRIRSYINK